MMTSKERVRTVLAGKEADRVPATMCCVETTWNKLMDYFKVSTIDEVQDILKIDTRIMDLPPFIGESPEPTKNSDGELEYTHPLGFRYVKKWNGVEYNDHTLFYPLAHIETMEDFESSKHLFPNPDNFDYSAVTAFCDKHTDKAIRIGWPGPYQTFTSVFPAEKLYIMMVEEPELTQAMLDYWCDCCLEIYSRMFIASSNRIDLIRCCDDYGTQISLLFSPTMWEEFFAANTKRFVALAHKHNCFYMQHSCGAIRPIIPNLIHCGVDAIEPIQKVVGLEVDGLKADFGKDLCFQGGVDTQGVLPFGTPLEVFTETKRVMEGLNSGGGYILAPSQDFEGDVPVENILALYATRGEDISKMSYDV